MMEVLNVFAGRLHPLLVHLPIGFVLLALALEGLSARQPALKKALSQLWFWAAVSAVFSALSGYLLSRVDAYESGVLDWHRNAGIATTVICTVIWVYRKTQQNQSIFNTFALVLCFLLLIFTSWQGAEITHGEQFLTTGKKSDKLEKTADFAATDIPQGTVAAPDMQAVKSLQTKAVVLSPVAAGSSYLSANFVNAATFQDTDAVWLEKLAPQLIWLKLGGASISDSALISVGKLTNLTRLSLENLPISDKGIAVLKTLTQLQTLNLNGTKVTENGLRSLSGLTQLRKIFLFHTALNGSALEALKSVFPKVEIDTGGYQVPVFETDTSRLKAPEVKKK
jgi:uncharacterized membrane protein